MKRLFFSERGTISIYFAIILTAIFLLNAVLIDLARVTIAVANTENAGKKAIRSTLSAFNTELRSYGLFGLTLSDEKEKNIFFHVLKNNLEASSKLSYANFAVNQLDEKNTTFQNKYFLANSIIFKHQLLEEMKYKAPATFIKNVLQPFNQVSDQVKATEQYTKDAYNLEQKVNEREDNLDKTWDIVKKIDHDITLEYRNSNSQFIHLSELAKQVQSLNEIEIISAITQLNQQLSDLKKSKQSYQTWHDQVNNVNTQLQHLKKVLNQIHDFNSLLSDLNQNIETLYAKNISLQNDLNHDLQRAKELNKDIQIKLKELKVNKTSTAKNKIEGTPYYIYSEDYFLHYQNKIATPISMVGSILNKLRSAQLSNIASEEARLHRLMVKNKSDLTVLENERARRNQLAVEQKKKKKNELSNQLSQAKQSVNKICSNNNQENYNQLAGKSGLTENYLNYSQLKQTSSTSVSTPFSSDPFQSGKNTLSLFNQLMNIANTVRDKVYIDEYALTYFNYRTYGLTGKTDNIPSHPENHLLQNQEGEYILYGLSTCSANIHAAYGEIFMIRWAINTSDAFMNPVNEAATPLIAVLAALTEGAARATKDMKQLTSGNSMALLPAKIKLKLGYQDYLRLLFLLQGNSDRILARMQALIQLNTGTDLRMAATTLRANVHAQIPLWFIPVAMKVLHNTNLVSGSVHGKNYLITKTGEMSY